MKTPSLVRKLTRELLTPAKPATAYLLLTHRCNAACTFCFSRPEVRSQHAASPELSLDEYRELARASGPLLQAALGGGEPFLRTDISDIVHALYEHAQVRLFSIPTNGSLVRYTLKSVEAMTRLAPRAALNLMVSLDALGPRHDALRGVDGLFERALGLCHQLLALKKRAPNLNVIINTTITQDNLDDVPGLCAFLARELADQPVFHNVVYDQRLDARLFVEPGSLEKLRALEGQNTIRQVGRSGGLTDRMVDRYYGDLTNAVIIRQRLAGRMIYRCNAGRKLFVVMPDGLTAPCEPFVFEPCYEGFVKPNLRDHGYRYGALRRSRDYQQMLAFIDRQACQACPWSCATITSLLYDPRNWSLAITTPSAAAQLAKTLDRARRGRQ